MIRAIGEKVIVEEMIEEEKEPENGIYVPDSAKTEEKNRRCKVISVGERVHEVNIDDVVLIPTFVRPVMIGEQTLYVTNEEEIICVIPK